MLGCHYADHQYHQLLISDICIFPEWKANAVNSEFPLKLFFKKMCLLIETYQAALRCSPKKTRLPGSAAGQSSRRVSLAASCAQAVLAAGQKRFPSYQPVRCTESVSGGELPRRVISVRINRPSLESGRWGRGQKRS